MISKELKEVSNDKLLEMFEDLVSQSVKEINFGRTGNVTKLTQKSLSKVKSELLCRLEGTENGKV